MKRADLEHVIRAAATIADDDELFVFGSQVRLATTEVAPQIRELVAGLIASDFVKGE